MQDLHKMWTYMCSYLYSSRKWLTKSAAGGHATDVNNAQKHHQKTHLELIAQSIISPIAELHLDDMCTWAIAIRSGRASLAVPISTICSIPQLSEANHCQKVYAGFQKFQQQSFCVSTFSNSPCSWQQVVAARLLWFIVAIDFRLLWAESCDATPRTPLLHSRL